MLWIKSFLVLLIIQRIYALSVYFHEKHFMISKKRLISCVVIVFLIMLLFLNLALFLIVVSLSLAYFLSQKRRKLTLDKRKIEFYGYKIFKFLMNQISSGILVSEAFKAMYRVVEDVDLRQCLIEVAACYTQTNDLEDALMVLKKAYKTLEVDTLCMAIEQGINTGTNMETLNKIESLLFKRYIYQIQIETKWRKKRSIMSVLLLCMILILMIAIPVLTDIVSALNQIFIS